MIELLRERRATRRCAVLEIGSGCTAAPGRGAGWPGRAGDLDRAAAGLHERALARLAPMALVNLRLVYGDGRLGHAPAAPFDAIIAAAGGA